MMLRTGSRGLARLYCTSANPASAAPSAAAPFTPPSTVKKYVVHAAGPERIGMLQDLADIIARNNGDILESRATILGKDFSMMMVVHCPEEDVQALDSSLRSLDKVESWVRPASERTRASSLIQEGRLVRVIRITGHNSSGIVAAVSDYLNRHEIRILNMASEMVAAPFTDDPMFKMRLVVDAPRVMTDEELIEGMDAVAQVVGVDMWVESIETAG